MAANEKNTLKNLRKEIDTIDDKLFGLLAERSELVEMVGKLKGGKSSKRSIIRPGREAAMIRRMSNKKGGVMSKAAIAYMWRLIISSSINIEENAKISALAPREDNECYWLAREYFGAFTPITKRPSTMEIIKDVIEEAATVGVMSVMDENAPKPWWVRLTESEEAPHVFAKLPFIKMAPSQKVPLVAIGYIEPEATGDDESLWVVKADELITFDNLEPLITDLLSIEINVIDHFRQVGNPTLRCYLLQLNDFVAKDDARMNDFLKKAKSQAYKESPIEAYYLGSYASPISVGE